MVFEGLARRAVGFIFVYALFIRFERGEGIFPFDFGNYGAAVWQYLSSFLFTDSDASEDATPGQLEQELAALMWPVLGVCAAQHLRHRLVANGRATSLFAASTVPIEMTLRLAAAARALSLFMLFMVIPAPIITAFGGFDASGSAPLGDGWHRFGVPMPAAHSGNSSAALRGAF